MQNKSSIKLIANFNSDINKQLEKAFGTWTVDIDQNS